jgi:hypothetical protein
LILLAKSKMREKLASTGAFMSGRGEIFPHLIFTSVVVHPHHGDFASSITFGEMRRFGGLATFSHMQVGRADHTVTEGKSP